MNFNNILGSGRDDNNDVLNTILIILIILIIIFSFGRNNQVTCGYTFGCFNPANLLPQGVSPESTERGRGKKCCEPCCRPNYPCNQGIFGGNFLWILVAIAFICLFCFKDDKHDDDDDCCC